MVLIPVLLLKTRSTPHDTYEEHFVSLDTEQTLQEGTDASHTSEQLFFPTFVPVLEHRTYDDNLQKIKRLLVEGALGEQYGGMIFTSQRAVEAFTKVVEEEGRASEVGKLRLLMLSCLQWSLFSKATMG